MALEIFISFAGKDAPWVENFTNSDWFFPPAASRHVASYKKEPISSGQLDEELRGKIDKADVFVALISGAYCKKDTLTLAELSYALDHHAAKGVNDCHDLVFVLLDNDAIEWWETRRQQLPDWAKGLAYADFANGLAPKPIVQGGRANDDITERIKSLSEAVRVALESTSSPTDVVPVVVLMHPTKESDQAVKQPCDELMKELQQAGAEAACWRDGWRKDPQARGEPAEALRLVKKKPFFVQVSDLDEASEYAEMPDKAKVNLRNVANAMGADWADKTRSQKDPRVALWLPKGLTDPQFEAKAIARRLGDVAYRTDNPETLCEWLASQIGLPGAAPVITLEAIGEKEKRARVLLREQLTSLFTPLLDGVGQRPPEPYEFYGDQLMAQLKEFSPVIVAVHDLSIQRASNRRDARQALDPKLRQIEEMIKPELSGSADHREPLWIAVIVNHFDYFPMTSYPGQFDRWRVLRLKKVGDSLLPDDDCVVPLRAAIRDWLELRAQV